jgi:hypothetical protein
MGLEMNEDVEELVEDHRKELVKFHSEKAEALKQKIAVGDKDKDKENNHSIPAEDLNPFRSYVKPRPTV